MVNIQNDFQLLFALSYFHVHQISNSVIKQLKHLSEEEYLLSGDDSGLKNIWEEICVQVQGKESIHWNAYEDVIISIINEELNNQPPEIQALISYIGSYNGDILNKENWDDYSIHQDICIKEIMETIIGESENYKNENITRFLNDDFKEYEEEENEEEENDTEEDEKQETYYTDPDNNELSVKIRDYIYKRYSSYIKGTTIWHGKASFTVDMLIKGSIETCKINPTADVENIVDDIFDYFCT